MRSNSRVIGRILSAAHVVGRVVTSLAVTLMFLTTLCVLEVALLSAIFQVLR